MRSLIIFCILLCWTSNADAQTKYTEQYRPRFHYSPAINWCNDPNGLVYRNGVYHLFHQYNPEGNRWGHMSWAHATSKDLVHWTPQPLALAEEKDTMIFSGTCVNDVNNTSGLGTKALPPMVAIYTGHIENVNQSQHLAYSLDGGIHWTKYNHNPILDLHKKDFRDPKVFWYAPGKYWVMAVVLPIEHEVQFYRSANLLSWKLMSSFGPKGDTSGVWECPDLVQIPVEGHPGKYKWLLQMSMNASMQYFIGDFNGAQFNSETSGAPVQRPDYGSDYYAAISFNQLPAKQTPVAIGWINNWNYANDIPTEPWKGMMSLPRQLLAKKAASGWMLVEKPVGGLNALRESPKSIQKPQSLKTPQVLPFRSNQAEIELLLEPGKASSGIRLAIGDGYALEIGYDAETQELYADRSKTQQQTFNANFARMNRYARKIGPQKKLRLQIFIDHSIVEVFANGGEAVMTMQYFNPQQANGLELFSTGNDGRLLNMTVWPLRSIW
jgi:fructan beta-fructosidase